MFLTIYVFLDELTFCRDDMIFGNRKVESGIIRFRKEDESFSGLLNVSLNYPGKEKQVVLYGEKGSIIYDPLSRPSLRAVRYQKEKLVPGEELIEGEKDCDYDEGNNIRLVLNAFRECIKGERGDNFNRALAVTTILERFSSLSPDRSSGSRR